LAKEGNTQQATRNKKKKKTTQNAKKKKLRWLRGLRDGPKNGVVGASNRWEQMLFRRGGSVWGK